MKKFWISLVLMLMMTGACVTALADRMYVLPGSDTRKLTREEIEEWDYESLGYAFNEIFARHGYNFIPGQAYDNYFRAMPWYTPNRDSRNNVACYPKLNSTEWYNVDLIKAIRAEKKVSDWGRSIWDSFSTGFDALQGFSYVELRANQSLAVYSAPSKHSWRGANGNAEVSTNGAIYAAGYESGWLLLMYETNNGSVRVGYVDSAKIRGGVPVDRELAFAYDSAKVVSRCVLTDDPARSGSSITTLRAGDRVTWLTRFIGRDAWDYVEVSVEGKTARGFVPAGSLDVDWSADPLESIGNPCGD